MPDVPLLIALVSPYILEILKPGLKEVLPGLWELVKNAVRLKTEEDPERLTSETAQSLVLATEPVTGVDRLQKSAKDPEGEPQRRLAQAAADLVAPERFVLPAVPLAARIFDESKYERPGTPIWEMWKQLLARACDESRVNEAHPGFIEIIKQLSADEAILLAALRRFEPRVGLERDTLPAIRSAEIGLMFAGNLDLYFNHLDSLGLLNTPSGWDHVEHAIMVDLRRFYLLSPLGLAFMTAVSNGAPGTP